MAMKLHDDKDAFQALLSSLSDKTRIRDDIIEKDYYITLLLSELASWQEGLPAYFKGGTALYKALGSLKRFSEDIDLTVEVQDNPDIIPFSEVQLHINKLFAILHGLDR